MTEPRIIDYLKGRFDVSKLKVLTDEEIAEVVDKVYQGLLKQNEGKEEVRLEDCFSRRNKKRV